MEQIFVLPSSPNLCPQTRLLESHPTTRTWGTWINLSIMNLCFCTFLSRFGQGTFDKICGNVWEMLWKTFMQCLGACNAVRLYGMRLRYWKIGGLVFQIFFAWVFMFNMQWTIACPSNCTMLCVWVRMNIGKIFKSGSLHSRITISILWDEHYSISSCLTSK